MWMNNLGIGKKILLIMLTITMGALLVSGAFMIAYEQHSSRESLAEELSVLVQVIASQSTAALAFGDKSVAQEHLQALTTHGAVDVACIHTRSARPFTAYPIGESCPNELPAHGYQFRQEGLVIQKPILLDNQELGFVIVRANLHRLSEKLAEHVLVVISILLAAAIIAGLVASPLHRLVSTPIRSLADTAGLVSDTRDYSLRAERSTGDETGQLVGAFNSMLDVIQEQDESLRESEARYRALVEGIAAVIYTANLQQPREMLYVSPQIETILGLGQFDWLNDPELLLNRIHVQDRAQVLRIWRLARAEGTGYHAEYRVEHPGGGVVWIRDVAQLVRDVEGKPLFYQGLMYDITESREARHALQFRLEFERAAEEISRRFIESDREGLDGAIAWSLQRAGELVDASRVYLFLFSAGGLQVSNTHEWCAPGVSAEKDNLQNLDANKFQYLWDALETERVFIVEDVSKLPDSQAYLRDTLESEGINSMVNVPLLWGNRLQGFIGFDAVGQATQWLEHDLDLLCIIAEIMASTLQRQEAQDALRQLNEKLERRVEERTAELVVANQEMEAFTYSVSHDLRSPLLVLDGFSQALLEDYGDKLDGNGIKYLGYLQEGSRELGELIDGLLLLSRATRGGMQRRPLDLSAMFASAINDLQAAEPERSVDVKIKSDLKGFGDPRLMRSVMENLAGNAWKYTGRKSPAIIEFGMIREAGRDMFFVRDNGAGFDMEYAEKLFQPFQRMHRADEFPGTGIGLATVKRIVRRHGGTVWADAAVDKGAVFYFNLPEPG